MNDADLQPRSRLPRVSVLILNWNGLRHLGPCLSSLHEMDYPQDRVEVILIDNGSTDESVDYVRREFPAVKVIENKMNLGFTRSNNMGARQATGEYVLFLNNDTRLDRACLRELVAVVESAPDVACAASKILTWEGDRMDFAGGNANFHGWGSQPNYGSPVDQVPDGEPREILFSCGGSMLIDREVFLECGGFDEDYFIYYEDVDLGWRLWVLGYRVLFAPRAITYHRFHGDTAGVQDEKRISIAERNALLSVIKNYDDDSLVRVLPAALLLMMERAYLAAAVNNSRYKLDAHMSRDGNGEGTAAHNPPRGGENQASEQVAHRMREEGMWQLIQRAFRKGWRVGCQRFIARFNKQLEAVPRSTLSQLVAAHDVIDLLPVVMAKRAEIQGRRRRSDRELMPLFRDPFCPSVFRDLYVASQQRVVDAFDLEALFAPDRLRDEGLPRGS
ncbi:MAG: glycosyltransferase family 2 protein [Anaerolineae bacterium]|nr:glycosyltransferase family 2 protein [Anaerolineae bacterium]